MRRALDPAEAGPGQSITTVEASDLQVVVADAHLLFTTAFSQIGDDVPLTGENGAILFIKDYFVLDAPPTLLSPAGAMMPPDLVTKLVGPMARGQYPRAATPEEAEPMGKVETLTGTAQETRADGVTVHVRVQLSHPSVSESRVDEFFQ